MSKQSELVLIAEGEAILSPPDKTTSPYGEYRLEEISMNLVVTILSACVLKKLVEKLGITIKTNTDIQDNKIIEIARNCPFIKLLSKIVDIEFETKRIKNTVKTGCLPSIFKLLINYSSNVVFVKGGNPRLPYLLSLFLTSGFVVS